jgi:hypothetical protein
LRVLTRTRKKDYRDIGDMRSGRQLEADSRGGPRGFFEMDATHGKPGVFQNVIELAVGVYKRLARRYNSTQEPQVVPQRVTRRTKTTFHEWRCTGALLV